MICTDRMIKAWLWYGLQNRDKNIYLPGMGWIMLDSAVIVGALVYG